LVDFRKQIEVSSPPDSALLRVAVEDPDSGQAALIANAVTEQLGRQIELLETPRGQVASRVRVTLTQPAEIPIEPSFPPVLLNLMLGVVGGACLGMVAAVVRHHVDRRMATVAELRRVTGAAPLGIVTRSRRSRRDALVARWESSSGAQEYRNIRSVFNLIYASKARHQFVVSSPLSGDGATTVATNLAISWAKAGSSVCLVDANLHRPKVAETLKVNEKQGLTDVLTGKCDLDDALRPWHNGSLMVLPTGSTHVDSAHVLGSQAAGRLVDQLRARFDVVIFDAPAMTSSLDAAALTRHVKGLVLVARANSTTSDSLTSALELARRVDLKVLGTVGIDFAGRSSDVRYYPDQQPKA
ncbi:MAG: polysaccharide biosynthesis tyrosine autokinase, partial [Paeniglutamicibacter sp.]